MTRRFFIQPQSVRGDTVLLTKRESHHAISVLRIKLGETVEIFDGEGAGFRGVASKISEGRLLVQLDQNRTAMNPRGSSLVQVTLAVSVIKPERMELLIQKSCELGVRRIVPLMTERSVVKLSNERWASKMDRWKKIMTESCKQCGRSALPALEPARKLNSLMAETEHYDRILIPTLALPGKSFHAAILGARAKNILVLIGPEGDFTKKEAELAVSGGAVPVSLGPLVMRAETAAIFVISVLNFVGAQFPPEISAGPPGSVAEIAPLASQGAINRNRT